MIAKKFILAVSLLAVAVPAAAQSVQQSGSVTPGHAARWITNGVIGDAGTAAAGSLTSLGVTNNGGPGICVRSGTSGAYNLLCLSASAVAGAITLDNIGGATGGFTFKLNGVTQGFPVVTLPVTTNDLACFADTTGTIKDCGTSGLDVVHGPATTTVGHVAAWNNTSGTLLQDLTNAQLTALINPATATLAGAVPTPPNDITKVLRGDATWGALPLATVPAGGTGGTSWTANLPLLGNGVNPLIQGTISGSTTKFVTTTGVLPTNDCVKIDASGNFVDSGATCGAGNNQAATQDFVSGAGFTPGVTTQLTLSSAPTNANELMVAFDGVVRSHNTYSLSGAVITFLDPIPTNTTVVEAQWYTATTIGGIGSIGPLTGGAINCGTALDCGSISQTLSVIIPPGGRLTLQSGVPVQNADQSGKSTIYYTASPSTGGGPNIPIPNGTSFTALPIPNSEISFGLSATHIIAGGASFTGSISGNVLTVTAVASGTLTVNSEIFGANTPPGMQISSFGTGTGGTGTYNVDWGTSTFTAGISGTTLSVSAISSLYGPSIGHVVSGSGVTAGTTITSIGANAGTYIVSASQTIGGGTSMTSTATISSESMTAASLNAYNIYAINNSGTAALCASPVAWNGGSRSGNTVTHTFNGSSVEVIHNTLGYYSNVNTLTNCWGGASGTTNYGPISADHALHLGAFIATADGQTSMIVKPDSAAGGAPAICGLYNDYQQIPIICKTQDNTSEWKGFSISSGDIWPCNFVDSAHGYGKNNRIVFLDALGEQNWEASAKYSVAPADSTKVFATTLEIGLNRMDFSNAGGGKGIGLDQYGFPAPSSNAGGIVAVNYVPYQSIGPQFLQCIEGSGNTSYFANDFGIMIGRFRQ